MAKKKDITRNPPSWIEKGLFISVIVIIIAIAFPIFWKLNETTRQLYACIKLQDELEECINQWKKDNNITNPLTKIPADELAARYGKQFPSCPAYSDIQLVKIDGNNCCSVLCTRHKLIKYEVDSTEKPKND